MNMPSFFIAAISEGEAVISLCGRSNTTVTLSTVESFFAQRAAAAAVWPPPTTIRFPIYFSSRVSCSSLRNSSKNSSAGTDFPKASLRWLWVPAPMARTTFSKPFSRSSFMEVISVSSSMSIPSAWIRVTSHSTSASFMRNFGTYLITEPPGRCSLSKIVTFTPWRARKHAVASPAGPQPTTAMGSPARDLSSVSSKRSKQAFFAARRISEFMSSGPS